MKNLSSIVARLLVAIGVSTHVAGYAQQPLMPGAAGQNPSNSGAAPAKPNQGKAQADVYQNPNGKKELPPLDPPPPSDNLKAAYDKLSPLDDTEIRDLRKRLDASKKATAATVNNAPKPEIGRTVVDLSPGAPPPLFTPGVEGGVVAFVDLSGEPWEIVRWVNMAKTRFSVEQPVESIPSLTITPLGDYVSGNLAVFLKGLPTPVVVRMAAAQQNADIRRDIQIPRRGPANSGVGITRGPTAVGLPPDYMQTILDGVETAGATPIELKNAPAGTKAWKVGDKLVLRTNFPLNNPASTAELGAADGTRVYEFAPTPIVTISDNGVLKNIYLELD